jgi:hypothetical protein
VRLPSSPAFCRLSRLTRLAAAIATCAAALAARRLAAQEKPTGPIVELPKFVVTDSRELPKPEAWRYAQIPGFEILSNASDRATKDLIRDFTLFKLALNEMFPVPTGSAAPTALILCGRGGKFDAFIPAGKSSTEGVLASLFLTHQDQSAIVIDFQASTLDLIGGDTSDDAATGTDSTQIAVEHNKQLYREYVHYLLGRTDPRPPAWLEEGMAQIIMKMRFDKENIYFGQLADQNEVSTAAGQAAAANAMFAADDPDNPAAGAPVEDLDFNAALKNKALVPLQEMFAMAHDSPAALNPFGNNRWAKQSYAFVHMCIYGRGGIYQKPFAQFLARLGKEPPSEALFQACFKMSYKKMLDELRGYLNVTDYQSQEKHAKKGRGFAEPPPLALREATQGEIGRIKGEAFKLAGHADLAKGELTAAYIRGERDPQLLAALGIFQHEAGDDERARKLLEAAVAARVERPGAYLALAQLRSADALAKPAGANGNFSAAQFASVHDLLMAARQQVPPLRGVYELLADTWARSPSKPAKEDVAVLVEGVRLFPTHLRLLYQTTLFCIDAGMNDVAWPLVEYGVKMSPDPKGKAMFAQLRESLPLSARPAGR